MRTLLCAGMLAAAGFVGWQVSAGANGSTLPALPSRAGTAEARAIEAYNRGISRRDRGDALEREADGRQGLERERLRTAARAEFEAALKEFEATAQLAPDVFQAYNGMGYAHRKLGRYDRALEMYDRAIDMAPGLYTEAIEYRAEAYLGLNRIDDAKQGYLDLFGSDRKQADLLLQAMKRWVEARRTNPAGVDPAALESFARWLSERERIALVTGPMKTFGRTATW
jgi:tetratricopeptide (TPR) repeat protein